MSYLEALFKSLPEINTTAGFVMYSLIFYAALQLLGWFINAPESGEDSERQKRLDELKKRGLEMRKKNLELAAKNKNKAD